MTIESITPDHLDKFRAGFHECVKEVNRYLSGSESKLDMRGHRHLTNHLNSCLERFHLPRSSWVQDHSNQTSGQTTSTTSNGHCELDNKTSREKMLPTRDIGSPSQRDCGDHRSLPNHHSSNVHHERRNDQDKMTAATGQHGKNVPDKIVVMLPDPLLPPPPLEMSVWRPWWHSPKNNNHYLSFRCSQLLYLELREMKQ